MRKYTYKKERPLFVDQAFSWFGFFISAIIPSMDSEIENLISRIGDPYLLGSASLEVETV
jgi:hypothetical protein